jgi:hypothetical protein
VALSEGMLFGELTEAEDDWLWHSDMTGNKSKLGLGCFGRLTVEKEKGRMESIGGGGVGGGHCMVWSTSLDANCYRGSLESCSIFLSDLRNMGQYLVWWLVSLPWYMQCGGLNVYGSGL